MHLLIEKQIRDPQGVIVVPLIDSLLPAVSWFAAVIAAVLGAFTIYTGVALAVALFHPDARTRRQATEILGQLLQAVLPRRQR